MTTPKPNVVCFKSIPEIYKKEKSGKKRNTCRYFNHVEPKFELLRNGKAKFIQITKLGSEESFTRKIKDITYWHKLVIISW